MKSLKCPECNAPIKVLSKGENFQGWRQCHKCGELTQVLATDGGEHSTQSLTNMLEELQQNKVGMQVLQFIRDSGTAHEKDIKFCVSKKAPTFLDLLTNAGILTRKGKKYSIKEAFEESIEDYIQKKIIKKSYDRPRETITQRNAR